MEWEINPKEYRYILGDFIRSGININYKKIYIEGDSLFGGKTIYFPYITGRQYQVYIEYHCVASENDSENYDIYGVCNDNYFKDWKYFCKAFDININDKSILHKDVNSYYYAFIYDYNVQFLEPPYSFNFEDGDIDFVETNIQHAHIYDIWDKYKSHNINIGNGVRQPFYPIYMSLDWFYFDKAKKIGIDTILKCLNNDNTISQNNLIENYAIDSFPYMSEEEIINLFMHFRDSFAGENNEARISWYTHTASLMKDMLKIGNIEHIAKKIRKVLAFCNNQGHDLSETSSNNIPYLKNVLTKYKKDAERIYQILVENDYIDKQTTLSDFKYYLTGELEIPIMGKIYWRKDTKDLVDFILCISENRGKWEIISQIFFDKENKSPTSDSLKSTKYNNFDTHTEKFVKLLK